MLGALVKLRPMEPSDAEALWRWNHYPDVTRWMNDGYAQPLAQVTGQSVPNGFSASCTDNLMYGTEAHRQVALSLCTA